jgi:hypothetical protein
MMRRSRMNANIEPRISEQEREQRRAAIAVARGSVRFEGFVLAPEVEKINQRFINGELTGDEHIAAIKAAALHPTVPLD